MKKEKGTDILDFIGNIIYKKKQVEDYSVYLTIKKVFKFTGKAELDFGGSEYTEAKTEEIEPIKRKPEDKYGWWELAGGEYLVEFNEKLEKLLPESKLVILQPAERITLNGTFHATKIIEKKGEIRLTLHVGESGINIKENARISKLTALD